MLSLIFRNFNSYRTNRLNPSLQIIVIVQPFGAIASNKDQVIIAVPLPYGGGMASAAYGLKFSLFGAEGEGGLPVGPAHSKAVRRVGFYFLVFVSPLYP